MKNHRCYLSPILLLILVFSGASAHGSSKNSQIQLSGEWAIGPVGENPTGIFTFLDNDIILNKLSGTVGKAVILEDGRHAFIFDDGIMVGSMNKDKKNFLFEGLYFFPQQKINLSLAPSNEELLRAAMANHEVLKPIIKQSQEQQVKQLIRKNLISLSTAFQYNMLLEGTVRATYEDVVGPDKLLKILPEIRGENYQELEATPETSVLKVIDSEGVEHAYQY